MSPVPSVTFSLIDFSPLDLASCSHGLDSDGHCLAGDFSIGDGPSVPDHAHSLSQQPETTYGTDIQLASWRNTFYEGLSYLEDDNEVQGREIISNAMNATETVLRTNSESPNLLKIMIDVTVFHPTAFDTLLGEITSHFANLATSLLGCEHPVTAFWSGISQQLKSNVSCLLKFAFVSILHTVAALIKCPYHTSLTYQEYHGRWREAVSSDALSRISKLQGLISTADQYGKDALSRLILQLRLWGAYLDADPDHLRTVVRELAFAKDILGDIGVQIPSESVTLLATLKVIMFPKPPDIVNTFSFAPEGQKCRK